MGLDVSKLSDLSSEEIADQVKSIAPAYQKYADQIVEDGIKGAIVLKMHRKNKIETLFNDIGVIKETQKERIINHFADLFPLIIGAGSSGGRSGGDISSECSNVGTTAEAAGNESVSINSSNFLMIDDDNKQRGCPICQLGNLENTKYRSKYYEKGLLYYYRRSNHPLEHDHCDCSYTFWGKDHKSSYGSLLRERIRKENRRRCDDGHFGLGSCYSYTLINLLASSAADDTDLSGQGGCNSAYTTMSNCSTASSSVSISGVTSNGEWWRRAKPGISKPCYSKYPQSEFWIIFEKKAKPVRFKETESFLVSSIANYGLKRLSYMRRDVPASALISNSVVQGGRDRCNELRCKNYAIEYTGKCVQHTPYTQTIGDFYQFKVTAPDEAGVEAKVCYIDRYYKDEALNYLMQACFVDRFGDFLPPRYGVNSRKNTYKYGRGKYMTKGAEEKNKPVILENQVRNSSNAIFEVIRKRDLRWPSSIKIYEKCYTVNQEKQDHLIEKLKAKKRNKAVTVFLSSPFDGCDDERNEFKLRIETLKSYCCRKGIFLKVINFQWGITDHLAREDKTVLRCMEAVDQADIFIGYCGARYGTSIISKPDAKKWLDPAIDRCLGKYGYLDGYRDRSVTEMEWQHAFLHNDYSTRLDKPICFFLFRSDAYDRDKAEYLKKADINYLNPATNDMRAKKERWYEVENEASQVALDTLKGDILRKASPLPSATGGGEKESYASVFSGDCTYSNPVQGAEVMFNCCDTLIRDVSSRIDILQQEDYDDVYLNQLAFLNSRLTFYSDWDDNLRTTLRSYIEDLERVSGKINYPLVISGCRGSGKSSHLAKTVDLLLSKPGVDYHVIYHFCGCDKNSQELSCLTERICKEFAAFLKDRILKEFVSEQETNKELLDLMNNFIDNCNSVKEDTFNTVLDKVDALLHKLGNLLGDKLPSVIFILDGIDQIEEVKYREGSSVACLPSDLKWLPQSLQSTKMKVVLSCLDTSKVFNVIRSERKNYEIRRIPKLNYDSKALVIKAWHDAYLKDYDAGYMQPILESRQCEDVMFLSMVLNQMLIHGTYSSISSKTLLVQLLEAKCVPSLMQRIILEKADLLRQKHSFDVDILREVMTCVYCSRGGLTAEELVVLLTNKYPEMKTKSKLLADINYESELPSILCDRLGLLTLEHKYVLDAVERTYILDGCTFADLEAHNTTTHSLFVPNAKPRDDRPGPSRYRASSSSQRHR